MKGNLNLIGTPLTHGYRFCDLFFVTRTAFVMYDTACMYFKTRVLRKTDVPLTKLRGKNIIKPKKYII